MDGLAHRIVEGTSALVHSLLLLKMKLVLLLLYLCGL